MSIVRDVDRRDSCKIVADESECLSCGPCDVVCDEPEAEVEPEAEGDETP